MYALVKQFNKFIEHNSTVMLKLNYKIVFKLFNYVGIANRLNFFFKFDRSFFIFCV